MDGNTHNVVSTNPLLSVKTSVRVQCEANDCGALLEIEIPNNQNGQLPVIVRCGNCQRLLEVWLNKGGRAVTSNTRILQQDATPPLRLTLDKPSPTTFGIQTKPSFELISMSGSATPLVKPPPLSRSHYPSFQPTAAICPFSLPVMQANFLPNKQTLCTPPFLSQVSSNSRSITSGAQASLDSLQGAEGRNNKTRRHRHPSPYNRFMSREVKRIKIQHPEVDHRRAFRMAASNWARSPTDCQRFYTDLTESASSVAESKDPPSQKTEEAGKTKAARKRSAEASPERLPPADDVKSS